VKHILTKKNVEGFERSNFAIAESAQEAFNFISNISQQKFAEETARVESQYQIALGSQMVMQKQKQNLQKI
jgi:hypothetical protein